MGRVRWIGIALVFSCLVYVGAFMFMAWLKWDAITSLGNGWMITIFIFAIASGFILCWLSIDAISCLGPYWWKRRD